MNYLTVAYSPDRYPDNLIKRGHYGFSNCGGTLGVFITPNVIDDIKGVIYSLPLPEKYKDPKHIYIYEDLSAYLNTQC